MVSLEIYILVKLYRLSMLHLGICMYVITMKKDDINFKKSKEVYWECMEGRKGRENWYNNIVISKIRKETVRKCSTDLSLSTGNLMEGFFSTEVRSSQVTLTCVKLTKKYITNTYNIIIYTHTYICIHTLSFHGTKKHSSMPSWLFQFLLRNLMLFWLLCLYR